MERQRTHPGKGRIWNFLEHPFFTALIKPRGASVDVVICSTAGALTLIDTGGVAYKHTDTCNQPSNVKLLNNRNK